MNKQGGFTLIELLAVIVILAIIAVIAVPIVLNIIDETKNNATLRSAEMYVKAVELSIAQSTLKNINIPDGEYNLKDGDICLDKNCTNKLKVEVNGNVPKEGTITVTNGNISDLSIVLNEKTIVKNNEGKLVFKLDNSITLADTILKNYGGKDSITEIADFSVENTGLYKAQDDYGTSYYFRGNIANNYVKLGIWQETNAIYAGYFSYDVGSIVGYYTSESDCEEDVDICEEMTIANEGDNMYWRIVRLNGDGSIRLIYDGTELVENGIEHTSVITYTNYNNYDYYEGYNINHEKYFGYTYEDSNGTQTDSNIKRAIDNWYETNLKNTYGTYIADGIFCNDRSGATQVTNSAEEGQINYAAYYRIKKDKTPMLMCPTKSDRYTVDDTKNGNALLKNPIGLITIDEAMMSGVPTSRLASTIYSHYLFSGDYYFTSSAASWGWMNYEYVEEESDISMFTVREVIDVDNILGGSLMGTRPVINLKADVKFTGDGTIDNPYEIVME